MPFVPALCTQCNARLEIDSSQEAAICPYCNTPFITEKAINNYNTTNITNIDNLHADVVNINNDASLDSRVKAGETFIKFKEYDKARNVFKEISEEHPYDYRGWWGQVCAISCNFSKSDLKNPDFYSMKVAYNKFKEQSPKNKFDDLKNTFNTYCKKTETTRNSIKDSLQNQLTALINSHEEDLNNGLNCYESEKESLSKEFFLESKKVKRADTIVGIELVVIWSIVALTGVYAAVSSKSVLWFFAGVIAFGIPALIITKVIGGTTSVITNKLDKKIESLRRELETLDNDWDKALREKEEKFTQEKITIEAKLKDYL